ncbi:uncharacterized protein RAG0_04499 [Rhynchosporium agropyri]|uniref:Metallo-beta-lactamase domain-containing protein n=1 Tax=Rhynchosporium agropyri TaxID=914238 RepID=A0A1E1K9G2_9HELO|nr:uncharacterized protein RAG0_04499 [Rhynchosporium agropyri]
MSLTVKHLNSDASFLLTFQPLISVLPPPGPPPKTFTIVLDPWLAGPSKFFHSKFSVSRHMSESCVTSLNELPEVDIIVISQDKSDHCHKETLTQLPKSGGKTLILAEPSAAKVIRGWQHFAPEKIITLPKFEDPRSGKNSNIYRIPVPSAYTNGHPGEVTITFLAQKPDITRVHTAIGITYRAQQDFDTSTELTPPNTPKSQSFSSTYNDRALSVLHAPHGCTFKTIERWANTHLVEQAALPLTALLHCFDRIQNAWYLGGNICSGLPGGQRIAQGLGAKVWISSHDGEKVIKGVVNKKIVVQKFDREEVESVVSPRCTETPSKRSGTRAVVLNIGEEVRLSSSMNIGPGEDDESEKQINLSSLPYLPPKLATIDSEKPVFTDVEI